MSIKIDIENESEVQIFKKILTEPKFNTFEVLSKDEQDLNIRFAIPIVDIDVIEEVEEGYRVWWKLWNNLEGKWVINSNSFSLYLYY